MNADIGTFAGGVETGNGGSAMNVGLDTPHDVVVPRADRYRLLRQIDIHKVHSDFIDVAKLRLNELSSQVAEVQVNAPVHPTPLVDLRLLCSGDHVTGGQLHHLGGILLHEPVTFGVEQVGPLSTGRLRHQNAVALEGGGMVLDHLHIHQGRACPIGQGQSVAGDDKAIG